MINASDGKDAVADHFVKVVGVDGLHEMAVDAGTAAADHVTAEACRRQGDDGNRHGKGARRGPADAPGSLTAVHDRHQEIQDHDIEDAPFPFPGLDRFLSVLHSADFKTHTLQKTFRQFQIHGVVVRDQGAAAAETAVPERGVKNRELQDFIDAFGMDRGVRLYQDGKTFDEARAIVFDEIAAENERLKARVAELETALSAKPENVEIVEPVAQSVESATATEPPKSEPEPAKSADALALALDRFETIISKLDESSAALSLLGRRGDAVGLTGSNAPVPTSKSYRDAFRDAVNLK